MVGSVTSIGNYWNQHPNIPITKLWHLISEIQKHERLDDVFDWLRNRSYLPRKDRVHGELVVKPEPGVDTTHDIGFANQNSINFHFGASFFRHI